jgi:hypothetical protein
MYTEEDEEAPNTIWLLGSFLRGVVREVYEALDDDDDKIQHTRVYQLTDTGYMSTAEKREFKVLSRLLFSRGLELGSTPEERREYMLLFESWLVMGFYSCETIDSFSQLLHRNVSSEHVKENKGEEDAEQRNQESKENVIEDRGKDENALKEPVKVSGIEEEVVTNEVNKNEPRSDNDSILIANSKSQSQEEKPQGNLTASDEVKEEVKVPEHGSAPYELKEEEKTSEDGTAPEGKKEGEKQQGEGGDSEVKEEEKISEDGTAPEGKKEGEKQQGEDRITADEVEKAKKSPKEEDGTSPAEENSQGNATVLLSNNDKTGEENIAFKQKYSMKKSEDNNNKNGKADESTDVHDSINSTLNTACSNPLTVKIEDVFIPSNDPYYTLLTKFNENFQTLQNELLTSKGEIQGLKETVNAFKEEIQDLKEELSTANKNSEDKIAEITEAHNKQMKEITDKLHLTENELKAAAERFRLFTIEATLNNSRQEFKISSLRQEIARIRSYFFAGFLRETIAKFYKILYEIGYYNSTTCYNNLVTRFPNLNNTLAVIDKIRESSHFKIHRSFTSLYRIEDFITEIRDYLMLHPWLRNFIYRIYGYNFSDILDNIRNLYIFLNDNQADYSMSQHFGLQNLLDTLAPGYINPNYRSNYSGR